MKTRTSTKTSKKTGKSKPVKKAKANKHRHSSHVMPAAAPAAYPAATKPSLARNIATTVLGVLFVVACILTIVIVSLAVKQGVSKESMLGKYGGVDDSNLVTRKTHSREFAKGDQVTNGADRPINVKDTRGEKKLLSDHIRTSAATIMADMGTKPARIETPLGEKNPAGARKVMQSVRAATKGDGQLRPVFVNGKKIADEYVKAAMFENQDFMPHNEFPLKEVPILYDPTRRPQRSPFSPYRTNAGMALDQKPGEPESMPFMSALDVKA
jgi:hypothetical protein